jgi:hypothetical protein
MTDKCVKCGLYSIRKITLKKDNITNKSDKIQICYKCGHLNWIEYK